MTVKKKLKTKNKSIYDLGLDLYWSGFCLTDNTNFCQFFVKKVPKLGYKFKKFAFEREDLNFVLDRQVTPVLSSTHAEIDGDFVDLIYYNLVVGNNNCSFYRLKSFLTIPTSNKIIVINEKEKPVGMFITKGKEEN